MQRTFASRNAAAMLSSAGANAQGNTGGIFKNFVMSAPVTRAPSVAPALSLASALGKRPLEPADDSSPSSNAPMTDGVCSQPTRLPSIADFDGTHSLPNTGQKSLHLRWHLVSNPRPRGNETAATPPKLETMQGKFKLAPKPPMAPEGDDISPLNLLSISSMMVSNTPSGDAKNIRQQSEQRSPVLSVGGATRTPPARRLFPKMGSTFAKTPSFDSLAHLTPQSDPGSRAPRDSTKSKPPHVTFSPPKQPVAKRPSSTGVSRPHTVKPTTEMP